MWPTIARDERPARYDRRTRKGLGSLPKSGLPTACPARSFIGTPPGKGAMPTKKQKTPRAKSAPTAAVAGVQTDPRTQVQDELDKLHAELAEMDLAGRRESLQRARIWASLLSRLDAMINLADRLHELGRAFGQATPDSADHQGRSVFCLVENEPAKLTVYLLERDLRLAQNRLPLLDAIMYSRTMVDAIGDVIGRIRGEVVDERHTAAESIAAAMLAVTQLYEQDYRKALNGIDGDGSNLRSPTAKQKAVLRILLAVRERLSAAEVAKRIKQSYDEYERADAEWVRKAVKELRTLGFVIDQDNGYLLTEADRSRADSLGITA